MLLPPHEIPIFVSFRFIPEALTPCKAAWNHLLTHCFSHIKISSMYTLTASRLSESCVFVGNICLKNSDDDLQKQCFLTGRKVVRKLLYFPFASNAEKYFQLFSLAMWWKTFPLCRFWSYTKVKDSSIFSTVLPALAQKLHPCYLLLHLLSCCCPVPQQFLFQGGVLPGVWTEGYKRVGKWRQCGFLILFWNSLKSSKVLGKDLLQCFCPFLFTIVSLWVWSPRS